jgi:glycosyltransferase involved in cell wall biosynthesis
VLPSKLFEYAATGKPLLAGIAGYPARFVAAEISNAAVFAPGDVAAGVRAFESLVLTSEPRREFLQRYARAGISRAMADDILALAASGV